MSSLATFKQRAAVLAAGYRVLEIGTRRWGPNPTHHKAHLTGWSDWVMTDFMDGVDVDVVSDAHALAATFPEASFDCVWASSVWEHLHSPWTAAEEVLKVLKPGGLFFIQTHQTFPIHGYPHDYFRYTREGMESLFRNATDVVSSYEYPCRIEHEVVREPYDRDCFLNVSITGRRK